MSRYLVVVTDDRHGSYKEEEEVLRPIDAELRICNCKDEKEAIKAVQDNNWSRVMVQCVERPGKHGGTQGICAADG